jgi:hypothetical protein
VKKILVLALVASFAAIGSMNAEEATKEKKKLKSGPQTGESLGAFNVTKVAGAEDDGVEEGKNLCYRCRNGSKPQVIVFTRSTSPKVANLVQELDKAVAENESSKLCVFVNVLGEDQEGASDTAKKFAATSQVTHIPFVVPNEFENGPDNYGINPDAELTVVMAVDKGVKANFAFKDAEKLNVENVMKNLSKILE